MTVTSIGITIGIAAEDETGIEIGIGTGIGTVTGTEIETVIVIASEMRRTMVVTGKERVGSGIAVIEIEIEAGGGATQGAEVEVGSERTVMATTVRGMHGALAQEDVEMRKMVFVRSPRKRKKRKRRRMMELTILIQKLPKQTGFVRLLD